MKVEISDNMVDNAVFYQDAIKKAILNVDEDIALATEELKEEPDMGTVMYKEQLELIGTRLHHLFLTTVN